ncbi:uncharacterized protein LOC106179807 isoform X1 [Lingula anatina]|uniref:Glycosyltransferase family 92 protein n=1 Tax=Lingula anatina TaxID=7574 RepID=A0A1S3K9A0_LINAN|nr:uncharacterized protein LOC106179807 isoform X1 [Lingula anatina]XP_013419029.1 uncharacterized protein LOC106179807 isoform X2 [Lingula anatina]XP_013419030.1 uncharacterized protein LOC106179807 isoform X1 [Lingula anatina]XP_013419031.1 uncharacterized protein LOC106179807 isoform X1 [Lingula anatina]|eukprot:XP_013419028.1 uncharacterized protein LOC106179807 isoform X1 [Lingula anatina]
MKNYEGGNTVWGCTYDTMQRAGKAKIGVFMMTLSIVIFYSLLFGLGLNKAMEFTLPQIKRRTLSWIRTKTLAEPTEPPLVEWLYTNLTTEMYILSAYYDDRPTVEFLAVRIIGVADKGRIEDKGERVFCVVWGGTNDLVGSVPEEMAATHIGPGAWSLGKYFREYIFVCPLTNVSISRPSFVSVIDETYFNKTKNQSREISLKETLATLPKIPVRYPERPLNKLDFGQCTSITYWTLDPYRIVEWVELHRIWGVKEMNIYGSVINDTSDRVFRHYHSGGFLKYTRIRRPMNETSEPIFLLMASTVINDCIYKNMYRYNKIVVVDLDELIVPRGNLSTYNELIETIDRSIKLEHPNRMYMFQNVYFFFELPQDVRFPEQVVTLRQIGRLRDLTPVGTAAKSIIDPMACTNMHNHFCWHVAKLSDKPSHTNYVNPDLGLNQHYKKCHFDRYMKSYNLPPCKEALKNFTTDKNMQRFSHLLIPRVKTELDKLGLPHQL